MAEALRTATHARHYQDAPQQVDAAGSRHWITRAANFVVVVTDAVKGAVLSRVGHPDEYMLLLPEVDASGHFPSPVGLFNERYRELMVPRNFLRWNVDPKIDLNARSRDR